jgi:hypothetical protein
MRRAKCFRCDAVFGIEEVVDRLLAPAPPVTPDPIVLPAEVPEHIPPFTLDDLGDLGDLDAALEPPMVIHHEEEPPPALPILHEPLDLPPFPETEEEARIPAFMAPEATTPETVAPLSGPHYASARDAIERLMGTAPETSAPRMAPENALDVEATLDALDTTLGGPAAPEPPAAAPAPDLSSTVKLSSEEIKIAMASMGDPAQPAPPPVREDFPPHADAPLDPAQSSDLFKVQLDGETCENLTIEKMSVWIEEGRVRPSHMVARQHSDHWIEASKVPSLLPIFDRVRKARGPLAAEMPVLAPEPPPVKRGLFSGLFGRN